MRRRLGRYPDGTRPDSLFEKGVARDLVREAEVFPKTPALSAEEWQRIKEYYLREAPDSLSSPPSHADVQEGLDHFRIRETDFATKTPTTTVVTVRNGHTFIGDAKGNMTILDGASRELFTMDIPNAPVSMKSIGRSFLVTLIGRIAPSDDPAGRVLQLDLRVRDKKYRYNTVLDSLQRPVDLSLGDLTGNGQDDLVVSEFGYRTGSLSWYEQRRGAPPKRHILRGAPGATTTYIRDLTGDGRRDVVALMGQGAEGIYLYRNQGNGSFAEEPLLQFPASYGSTSFALTDFNDDGAPDILYTAGDNADYEPVMKPYHGVRIFLNDGDNNFQEAYFYPLNGAYKAIPGDFDGDGDLDIAAISFFPNYTAEEESFVYLENQGDLTFEPSTFENNDRGRWLVMDSGDIDEDGDTDLVLGSFSALQLGTAYVPDELSTYWTEKGPPAVVLENTSR